LVRKQVCYWRIAGEKKSSRSNSLPIFATHRVIVLKIVAVE
jgi:hypothetical protein